MITINPKEILTNEFHSYMLGTVAPRPIAFASTIDENGIPNLAPYSFFNAYSSNPPTLVFSSNRRVRDNTTKDTYANIKATGEVVINMVSFNIVRQMSLASIEYPSDINEFEKAGFTPLASETVKPFRVAESPAQYECKVKQIIELGEHGGAGNLFICEVQLLHINENILNEKGKIDPDKIDLCARMGGQYYLRASGSNVFEINQPVNKFGIGFDNIPENIRLSKVLTGNNLAELASVEKLPSEEEIKSFAIENSISKTENSYTVHARAKSFIEKGDALSAWKILLFVS
jgi:flavin reductase (DIM6/NTAB) family NADH-FMN oxidoreductase RutF